MINYILTNIDNYNIYILEPSVRYQLFATLILKIGYNGDIITILDTNGRLVNIETRCISIYKNNTMMVYKPLNNRRLARRRSVIFKNLLEDESFEYFKLKFFT